MKKLIFGVITLMAMSMASCSPSESTKATDEVTTDSLEVVETEEVVEVTEVADSVAVEVAE